MTSSSLVHSRNSYLNQQPTAQPPPIPTVGPIGHGSSSSEQLSSTSTSSQPTVIAPPTPQTPPVAAAVPTVRNRVLDFPAVRFLLRPDFFSLLHLNDEALAQYNGSPTLKAMATRIRREGQQNPPLTGSFERHQHNRYLVSLINKFAETNRPLPHGNLLYYECLLDFKIF